MKTNFTQLHFPKYQWKISISFLQIFILLLKIQLNAQIIDDGNPHTISYNGSFQDFVIPSNNSISKITFTLNGGDGGKARVHDAYPDITCLCDTPVEYTSNGGAGATTNLTFLVGSGAGKIPHGSTIRFVVGGRGSNGSSGGTAGVGFDYGGGGGGTAVLYQEPGGSNFILIGVAGGGGGAYQGMFAFSSVDSENGQGGRSGTGGGSGSGDLGQGPGGSNGNGGGSNPALGSFGGGGGGALSAGGGVDCVGIPDFNSSQAGEGGPGGQAGGYGGDADGCFNFSWRNGGFGFGGGGAGSGAGGGGGGFSGGGVGGTTGSGGGGGSFMASFRESGSVSAGGSISSPANGFARYQVTLNFPPTVTCKSTIISLDQNGNASIVASDITESASDPEGGVLTFSISKSDFTCAEVGQNTVILTVTDNVGQTATCSAIVTVQDKIAPTVLTQNVTIQLDATGAASITTAMINNGSTDNCGVESHALDKMNFNCSNMGNNTVILTVLDVNGNTASKTATVTVEDNIAPTVVTQNVTIQLDASGSASITTAMINNGSSDNCEVASYALDKMNFNCSNVGNNTVILTVLDVNGNTASKTATVTVEDNIAPSITSTTPNPAVLWPPNHKMVPVTVNLQNSDNCAGSGCKIIGVTSNEPLNSTGDGNTDVDWMITSALGVDLRAERSGNLTDRIYTILIECTDASGNKTTSTTTVTVPHNGPVKNGRESAEIIESSTALNIKVLENPSSAQLPFIITIESANKNEEIQLKLMDSFGRLNDTKSNIKAGDSVEIGKKLISGMYFIQAIQNEKIKVIKLLKN